MIPKLTESRIISNKFNKMKRNNDKISSKYRILWFGSVTEVKPGTATIGNFRRLRPV